jgi:FkbM family methyltransferase
MTIQRLVKNMANSVLQPLGLVLERRAKRKAVNEHRHTLRGTLEQARKIGFEPATVIDVGAAGGTYELYETFLRARHLLIEPLEENRPFLERVTGKFERVEYLIAAAAQASGTRTLNVHPDLEGSSLYREAEDSDVNGVPRVVPAVTLDEVCRERHAHGPYLLKLDVQGAELDVLAGAGDVLGETELLVTEVSLFEFFQGGPLLHEVIAFLKGRGFVAYDILDYHYRLLDGAMSQVNMTFVKQAGMFRRHHCYATREQRAAQDAEFRRARQAAATAFNGD